MQGKWGGGGGGGVGEADEWIFVDRRTEGTKFF